MPRVSVVVPAYNALPYVRETVEGVLDQTFLDWELIAVDDGSTDGTSAELAAYAARDPRIHVFQHANAGMAGARNSGFRHIAATSDYVTFLDADDIWEQDALAALVAALEANPRAIAAHGYCRYIDAQSRLMPPPQSILGGDWRRLGFAGDRVIPWDDAAPTTFAVLAVENAIFTPGQALIRRPAIEAAMPFDGEADLAADWDMWLRLSLLGEFAYVPRPLLRYRRHGANASLRAKRMERNLRYVRHKLIANPALTAEQRRIVEFGRRWGAQALSDLWWRWAKGSLADHQYLRALQQAKRAATTRARYHLSALVGA